MMTTKQKILVQSTYEALIPDLDLAGELFYRRLFQLDHSLERKFTNSRRIQGKRLFDMFGLFIKGLDYPDENIDLLTGLGLRHVAYGVQDHHYQLMRDVLIWTLAIMLDARFTPEVKQAWLCFYDDLAGTMKRDKGHG